jgi:hypothetical protein
MSLSFRHHSNGMGPAAGPAGPRRHWAGRRRLAGLALWLLLLLGGSLGDWAAQTPTPAAKAFTETEVKAAYLFNFANFVDWPSSRFANTNAPLVLGLFGRDDVAHVLEDIVQRRPGKERPRVVRRLASPEEARLCHVVFVGKGKDAGEVVSALKGTGVLTVGESEGFLEQGGLIQFALVAENVLFDINQAAAEEAGLKISSKVLTLARKVWRPNEHKPAK